MSTPSEDGVVEIDKSTLQQPYHLSRQKNFLTSALLRLPTELILKIFKHSIELDDEGDSDESDGDDYHYGYGDEYDDDDDNDNDNEIGRAHV